MKQRSTVRNTPALMHYSIVVFLVLAIIISSLLRRIIRLKITLFFCFYARNLRKTAKKKLSMTGVFKIEETFLAVQRT
jgi:hypothetical protein